MRPLIEAGYVYFAMPPSTKLQLERNLLCLRRRGEKNILEENVKEGDLTKIPIQRYKVLER